MRFFFRSRQFKLILSIFLSVVTLAAIFGIYGRRMTPGADFFASISAPFRNIATEISSGIKNTFTSFKDGNRLMLENADLKKENMELQSKLSEYENTMTQNEFLKEYLGLREQNPDFTLCDAKLISRDSDDPYKGFVINKGSLSGLHKYDPVITDKGLVGYVKEVGVSTAKVETILSPDLTLGALGSRTGDSGIISGELKLANENKTKLSNLSRSCSVAIGDFVETSGEGIFPQGLLVGKIETIGSDKYNTSIYAEITPFVDFSEIKAVMVITDFAGKGGIAVGKGE